MRTKIIAGNWKMQLSYGAAIDLNTSVEDYITQTNPNVAVYQFVPFIYLKKLIDKSKNIKIGAQNGHPAQNGAFTGEISMHQLSDINTHAILIGHSERRQLFYETNDFLKKKVDAALSENLTVFFCCGETFEEKERGIEKNCIRKQLETAIFHLNSNQFSNVIIAYEPIWAIGTGKTATPKQANDMHHFIRQTIAENYDLEVAKNTSILYGGSCKPSNAKSLLSMPDIDGGLIGGASLKAEDFTTLIHIANTI